MRLGQLAREKGLKTLEVRDALVKEFDLNVEKGPNTKLTDEHISFIAEKFAPIEDVVEESAEDLLEELNLALDEIPEVEETQVEEEEVPEEVEALPTVEEVESDPENVIIEEEVEPIGDKKVLTVAQIEAEAERIELAEDAESKTTEETEAISYEDMPLAEREQAPLIKAPKVEIPGFKVVDKIDLPEPKIKEEVVAESESEESPAKLEKKPARKPRKQHKPRNIEKKEQPKKKKKLKQGPSKRDMQEAKFKESYKPKQKQVKGKKKKQQQKVKVAEKVNEEAKSIAVEEKAIQQKVEQKSLFGRLWHWLNNG